MHARRNHLILVGIIVATLVGVALLAIPGSPAHKDTRLGLDLQGGLEVVLQAVPPKGQEVTQQGLDNAVSIMRNRVDKLGVSEPEIRKQGSDQIVVQLPGVKDAAQAAQLIGKTAQLEFYDLQADLTGPSVGTQGFVRFPVATTNLYNLLAGQQSKAKTGTPTDYYLFGKNKKILAGPSETREGLFNSRIRKVPAGGKVFAVPHGTVVITCTPVKGNGCPGTDANGGVIGTTYYYLFKYDPTNPNEEKRIPEMTGADLKSSGTQADFDPQTGAPVVRLAFTGQGNRIFQRITKTLYQRGRLWNNTPQQFAIVLDREIKSWPQIDPTDPSLSNGISGGGQITNIGKYSEAKDLAIVLQTGALPYVFKQQEQSQISATLGKDSLREAKIAAAIGLIVVALFLLLFYRFLGVIAVIGLAVYAALLYGVILLLHVTLTLPGFAGMILTIGVAADANVVIFERIKEEVRSGKSVRAAIGAGYSKGFHTIVDANVVTAITALVLFAVATAGVKGFALMLLIGTALSLLTAVAATRAMLGMLADTRWFNNPNFMGAKGQAIANWQRIDVNSPKRRRLFLTIATAAIVASVALLIVKGLNLGIDFKGGTQITFTTPQAVSLAKVRDQMGAVGRSDAVVQGRGQSTGGDNYRSFQIRTRSLSAAQQGRLQTLLENELGANSSGVKNVSSSFSRQIARGAIYAILVSFLLISIYISLRFQWRFAVPILRTLFNDIVITLGVYSLSGREVTTATVAAVLTVLGYSIYDTIIVFDRVRENMPLMPRARFATIANISLWETMRRSLATTFITLLPIGSLLLFGGATLKDFAFALFVGIGLGAISTFFVATPFLTVLMERSPDFRRRTGEEVVERSVAGVAAEPEPEPEAEEALVAAAPSEPDEPQTQDAAPTPAGDGAVSKSQAKRERRRQRRRTRPHGRAR